MKHISIILLCLSALFITGCSQARSRAAVMYRFPDADVINVPGCSYDHLVRLKDGTVLYARCLGVNGEEKSLVYDIVTLFPANK